MPGEGTVSIGEIDLAITMGDYPIWITKIVEFVVVDIPSAYNVILERPILISLGAVSSVRYLSLKFPTPKGVGIIKGDQLAARECYNISTRGRGSQQPKLWC